MIFSNYSSKEFKKILDGLESKLGRAHIPNRVLNDNIQVINNYNQNDLELLISGLKNNKLSAPHSWLETLIFLNDNNGISFTEHSLKDTPTFVHPTPFTEINQTASNSEISNRR